MTDLIAIEQAAYESATRATQPAKCITMTKLLRRAKGATVTELREATSWRPHSVRAFLSGLRKKGGILTKEQRKSGETAYRLANDRFAVPGSSDPA